MNSRPDFPRFNAAQLPRHADNVRQNTSKSQAGAVLGSSKSGAKTAAAQENGKKGGRPAGS